MLGGASSPPARPRSSERGGSASGLTSGVGGLAPSSPSPSGGGGAGVARSRQASLSRVSESVDSPQFSPHVPRRENSRESSVSCSRDSRSSGRGSRKDKRARSREGSSRGRRRRSRSSSRSRSRGRERGRQSSSASRSSRSRSRRERSRSSDRYRSRRGSSRSRRDRSRSSDRYRSRRGHSRRERARSPVRRGERRDRSRSHALPSRSRSSVRLPASPARLRAEEAGRLARLGAQEGVEALASQPPVAPGETADVTPVAGGASMTALPSAMRELAKFFLNLSGSSSLGATGDFAGVTASAAASGGIACPSSTAAGAATICAAAVTPAGAGVCLVLPLLFLACLVSSSVRWNPALAGVAVDRLVRGPTSVPRSDPEGGLLLLNALHVVGGSAIALPQIRLRKTELTLLLLEPGMRMEVRVMVALPGILTKRGLLQGKSLTGLELVVGRLGLRAWQMMTAPLPSSR